MGSAKTSGRKRLVWRSVALWVAVGTVLGAGAFARASGSGPTARNPFGVMLPARLMEEDAGVRVAKALGVRSVRPDAVLTATDTPTCPACGRFREAGFDLVLTVRHTSAPRTPSRPPRDLGAYGRAVEAVVARYRPALLVVENEENSALFYAGTPEEYGAQLRVACEAAHRLGTPCTNGGLVGRLVALLVYDGYRRAGQVERAADFARRVFPAELRGAADSPRAREQLERGRRLLRVYRQAGADFVNFHWYEADPGAFAEAVRTLRQQTSLPVVTNEVGQRNENPAQTTALMEKILQVGLPVAVWFGRDGPRARGLVEPDGRLRATGAAFARFVREQLPANPRR